MIYDSSNETHERYVQALKALDRENAVSEYRKIAETPEERAFMTETNRVRFSRSFAVSLPEEQYMKIFGDTTKTYEIA